MDKAVQLLAILSLYFASLLLRNIFWANGYIELKNMMSTIWLGSVVSLFTVPMLDKRFWATSN